MSRLDLACTVCSEEFRVPIGVYNGHSGVVPCPCCGSTDLVLLGEVGGSGLRTSPASRGGTRLVAG
jgi:hypothetical protein